MKNMMMPMMGKMKMKVKSDHYFNHPEEMKDMGMYSECTPVDVTGGFVPQDKSMDNLKKMEESIQEQYGLTAGGEH